MNFSSISELFYKLYNIFLMMIMVPLLTFLIVYYLVLSGKVTPSIQNFTIRQGVVIVFPLLAFIDLTIVQWVVRNRFKSLSREVSLGKKLEQYHSVAVMRVSAAVATSMFMAAGLFLTGDRIFSIFFIVILGWYLLYWPRPKRVVTDLKLKGDEARMVLTKGEAFK